MKIQVELLTGGTRVRDNKEQLKQGCHVVVGTPGRIKDLIERGALHISCLKMFILDEADEMLGLGFLG